MLKAFLSFIQKEQLILDRQKPTLIAVSGGVDSIVLCHLFKEAALPFAMVHCHFNLRGTEADHAAQFVEKLAKSYQVPYYSTKLATRSFASSQKISIQMAARTLRYRFFYYLRQREKLQHIATAHHWDDVVETLLLNLIKGIGRKGWYGMQPTDGALIRPLLFTNKKEILAYASAQSLTWQEDSSNQSLAYQRNFVRQAIIPLACQLNPSFSTTLRERYIKLKDIDSIFQCYVERLKKELCTTQEGIYVIQIDQIAHLPWATTVAFALVEAYGFTFQQVQTLIQGLPSGKIFFSTHYRLHVDRNQWLITKNPAQPLPETSITASATSLYYGNYIFHFHTHDYKGYILSPSTEIASFRKDKLIFPLTIRPWQAGDFFYPLGMQGRKKISDFFIDKKIPIAMKQEALVITSNHQIIWIVGYRIDDRFKIDDETEQVFEITLSLSSPFNRPLA